MSPPTSDLFSVKTIPGAGRGIIANCEISKDTTVLNSEPPVAHVLFREYRKEVCAQCFLYDRGHHRPNIEEIDQRWKKAQGEADEHVRSRSDTSNALNDPGRKQAKRAVASSIDSDILGYLLSGILYHDQQPDRWREAVLTLAMHDEPYSTTHDLEAHCNSFAQLSSIMPVSLLRTCTVQICRALAAVSSHNAFGIRSGGEDGEEYMGYGVYPSASCFNHSCHPNVAKQRVGNVWRFWVTEDVRQEDELCISYLGGDEKDLNVRQRRGHLQEVWGFVCECARCQREAKASQDGG
ncbi:Histone-lysine N-methyltransferase set-6 [Friedmanniomyces endolithicus]|uniref:Histone-lysine N-methyltransferase set-6 n=1 Tax=Friedmanniomyces endolithicus TaxID=329885 RepID=A0AAN6FRV9_9PEZI|nr:Histone-lysine N-methyltransferase set-6 [Friedmanniomyces endolithicus]KAK0292865.1 Histone-lysine N-methyltransferase set-6 [Friedmanniomyces endolithicus]KAK0323376.1 Histone-lysine N-methyltransferase set-6 [Friedmanniomyces endolithicus]KAK1013486.1 Histone-lysine N-methyltransferase set-6 [Friedmanniomyces endolithicus]